MVVQKVVKTIAAQQVELDTIGGARLKEKGGLAETNTLIESLFPRPSLGDNGFGSIPPHPGAIISTPMVPPLPCLSPAAIQRIRAAVQLFEQEWCGCEF